MHADAATYYLQYTVLSSAPTEVAKGCLVVGKRCVLFIILIKDTRLGPRYHVVSVACRKACR